LTRWGSVSTEPANASTALIGTLLIRFRDVGRATPLEIATAPADTSEPGLAVVVAEPFLPRSLVHMSSMKLKDPPVGPCV